MKRSSASWECDDRVAMLHVSGASGPRHNASEYRPVSSDHSGRCPEGSD